MAARHSSDTVDVPRGLISECLGLSEWQRFPESLNVECSSHSSLTRQLAPEMEDIFRSGAGA